MNESTISVHNIIEVQSNNSLEKTGSLTEKELLFLPSSFTTENMIKNVYSFSNYDDSEDGTCSIKSSSSEESFDIIDGKKMITHPQPITVKNDNMNKEGIISEERTGFLIEDTNDGNMNRCFLRLPIFFHGRDFFGSIKKGMFGRCYPLQDNNNKQNENIITKITSRLSRKINYDALSPPPPTPPMSHPFLYCDLKNKKKLKSCLSLSSLVKEEKDSDHTRCNLSMRGRTVSFSNLQIREYDIALSDNPSCSRGPPIQLCWKFKDCDETVDLEEYEEKRIPRRQKHHLVMGYHKRKQILRENCKYSKKEISEVMDGISKIKKERLITHIFMPASAIEEAIENISLSWNVLFNKHLRRI